MNRYSQIPETKSPDGKLMYKTVRYPDIPKSFEDKYVYTTIGDRFDTCLLYTSPSPRDLSTSRMPASS